MNVITTRRERESELLSFESRSEEDRHWIQPEWQAFEAEWDMRGWEEHGVTELPKIVIPSYQNPRPVKCF